MMLLITGNFSSIIINFLARTGTGKKESGMKISPPANMISQPQMYHKVKDERQLATANIVTK